MIGHGRENTPPTRPPVATVLVTGAQGFVGRPLCRTLANKGYNVRAAVRRSNDTLDAIGRINVFETGELTHFANWQQLLRDVDAVVHLVARTHVTDEYGAAAMAEYRQVNVDVTRRLAKACVREGVSQFVYMSSIKAVGNGARLAYTETTKCQPEDSYGITKLEAEQQLRSTMNGTACGLTILRPPLVYGPGVGGNFLRLMKLVEKGVPLPSVANARSMVHVSTLVDAVVRCLRCEKADDNLFHVSDPLPVSTSDLVRYMAMGLNRKTVLVPVPKLLLSSAGHLVGKQEEIKRLIGSLTVSTEKIVRELNWRQLMSTKEGVIEVCRNYRISPWGSSSKPKDQTDAQRNVRRTRRAA